MRTKFVIALTTLAVCVCTFSKMCQDSVVLPEGSTLDAAKDIAMIVWNDDFKIKVHKEFPELTESQLEGLFIKWRQYHSLVGDKKTTVSIIFGIQYQGELDNARVIVKYCKMLIEEAATEYLKKSNEVSMDKVLI